MYCFSTSVVPYGGGLARYADTSACNVACIGQQTLSTRFRAVEDMSTERYYPVFQSKIARIQVASYLVIAGFQY